MGTPTVQLLDKKSGTVPVFLLAWVVVGAGPGLKTTGFALTDPAGVTDLGGLWLYHAGDNPAFARPNADDTRWDQRRVPTQGTPWTFRGAGYGWYRLHVSVEQDVAESDQMLSLGQAREAVEVYVNGSLVGERGRFGSRPSGGARVLPLTAIIPARVLTPGNNVIAVRVYDPTYDGGLQNGPVLIGAPAQVRARIEPRAATSIAISVGLAIVSLCLGLGVLLARTRVQSAESVWLVYAAFAMMVYHLDGVGLLEAALPNVELAVRLPTLAVFIAAISFAKYFASRYDARVQSRLPLAQALMLCSAAVVLFVPASWIFFGARPATLSAMLVTTLFAADACGRSIRRKEPGSVIVFLSLVTLIGLGVTDALAHGESVLPPLSAIGAVGVALIATFANVRQASRDYASVVQRMQTIEKTLDERTGFGILDATVLSINSARVFLNVAIHEAARELGVRRCSLVVAREGGELAIEASVGLPKHATSGPLQKDGSIAHYVFEHGARVTDRTLPQELTGSRRAGTYMTTSFICQPIQASGKTIGVLNVSDRHDGRPLGPNDEAVVAQVSTKIAIVLARVR